MGKEWRGKDEWGKDKGKGKYGKEKGKGKYGKDDKGKSSYGGGNRYDISYGGDSGYGTKGGSGFKGSGSKSGVLPPPAAGAVKRESPYGAFSAQDEPAAKRPAYGGGFGY